MKQQQKPWVETPLKESSALSKAVGWYVNLNKPHLHVYLCQLDVVCVVYNDKDELVQWRGNGA
ncbi:hypothetical protein K432DRAFT_386591 [Lepidopterella palustris CBS 459.81]|uniref:Uncharacterized protein n=1 Tax=Lepidopterella palustris CBS 459.81 TaxID=1314670 RepID=A0A8E2J9X0_9PEZI|nr:hypothetical protein K432DRAFT_386591 [Lepidopterella palustris CBS 459.81]